MPALHDPVARWQRVAALFDAAREREPAERARYLEKACRDRRGVDAVRLVDAGSILMANNGVPADNAFIDNRLDGFRSTVADIVLGSGVTRAHIAGSGSLSDHGTATARER